MTPAEFVRAATRLKLHPDHAPRHLVAARAHLVDGLTLSAAGQMVGISPQAVHSAVNRIKRAAHRCPHCGRTD